MEKIIRRLRINLEEGLELCIFPPPTYPELVIRCSSYNMCLLDATNRTANKHDN
jgi:hypothetical protein